MLLMRRLQGAGGFSAPSSGIQVVSHAYQNIESQANYYLLNNINLSGSFDKILFMVTGFSTTAGTLGINSLKFAGNTIYTTGILQTFAGKELIRGNFYNSGSGYRHIQEWCIVDTSSTSPVLEITWSATSYRAFVYAWGLSGVDYTTTDGVAIDEYAGQSSGNIDRYAGGHLFAFASDGTQGRQLEGNSPDIDVVIAGYYCHDWEFSTPSDDPGSSITAPTTANFGFSAVTLQP